MIPVRIHRVIIVLIGISVFIAGANTVLEAFGLHGEALRICSGVFAGFVVFCLAMQGGRTLLFCARGLVKPSQISSYVAGLMSLGGGGELDIRVSPMNSNSLFAVTVQEGRHCRTFISRGLLVQFSQEGIRGVAAHECGHVMRFHTARLAVLLGVIAGVKFSVGISLLPSIAILVGFVWMLRRGEYVADRQAVKLVGADAIKAALKDYQTISGDKSDDSIFLELLSAHPRIARRVVKIDACCGR